jgi:hypothetical protein
MITPKKTWLGPPVDTGNHEFFLLSSSSPSRFIDFGFIRQGEESEFGSSKARVRLAAGRIMNHPLLESL